MSKPIALEVIATKILEVRGKKVMLDSDLAKLYGVKTKVLLQSVKRNMIRFPGDFMYQLTRQEVMNLRSHFVTSSWGGKRYLPYAFTQEGVAMLSSVLNSPRAIQVNIHIMRAFVKFRSMILTNEDPYNENPNRIVEPSSSFLSLRSKQVLLVSIYEKTFNILDLAPLKR